MLRVLLYPQEQRAFIPISASQLQLAEGVEFIEKYAHLDHLEAPIGGKGRWFKWIAAVQAVPKCCDTVKR